MTLVFGLLIIAAAVLAVIRKADVRLALLLAALALGTLVGKPAEIVHKFFATFTAPEYLVPIGSAMGFAYVLRHTGCDRHLVQFLVRPLRRIRALLIPGAVLVGFQVNIPIISQTSSAVAIGSVLVPLLLAARISPVTAGSALLLGASIGGELLNPGAPEFRTVVQVSNSLGRGVTSAQCVQAVLPLVILHLAVATAVFWAISQRAEAHYIKSNPSAATAVAAAVEDGAFQVNLFKAAVPLVPLALLFMIAPPLQLFQVPREWLVEANDPPALFESRLIGAAMLVGVVVAALTDLRAARGVAYAFFDGAGYALTQIISIIVAAACFGKGVQLIGLDRPIGMLIAAWPQALLPASGFLPLGFGAVSGSGMAATQSLYEFFARPALHIGVAPEHVGAVVSLGAAAGRTMSPVAAVVLMCASLTVTNPTDLVRRVALPLLGGMVAVVVLAMALAMR